MKNRFNENLLNFIKKQLPEDVVKDYEELYNLYADGRVEFKSQIHTLEIHLDLILQEFVENATKLMHLRERLKSENAEKDVIYSMMNKILNDDVELLKAELEDAKSKIVEPKQDQEAIEKMHFDSGKFGS